MSPPRRTSTTTDGTDNTGAGEGGDALSADEIAKLKELVAGGGGGDPGDGDRRYTRAEMEAFAAEQTAAAQAKLDKAGTGDKKPAGEPASKDDGKGEPAGSTGGSPPQGGPAGGDRRKGDRRAIPPPASPAPATDKGTEHPPRSGGRFRRFMFGDG